MPFRVALDQSDNSAKHQVPLVVPSELMKTEPSELKGEVLRSRTVSGSRAGAPIVARRRFGVASGQEGDMDEKLTVPQYIGYTLLFVGSIIVAAIAMLVYLADKLR